MLGALNLITARAQHVKTTRVAIAVHEGIIDLVILAREDTFGPDNKGPE